MRKLRQRLAYWLLGVKQPIAQKDYLVPSIVTNAMDVMVVENPGSHYTREAVGGIVSMKLHLADGTVLVGQDNSTNGAILKLRKRLDAHQNGL